MSSEDLRAFLREARMVEEQKESLLSPEELAAKRVTERLDGTYSVESDLKRQIARWLGLASPSLAVFEGFNDEG